QHCQCNRNERGGQEDVHLSLNLTVDVLDPEGRRLFVRVILLEQPRHTGAERRLPGLQRESDLRARLGLLSTAGQRKDSVGGVPELREGALEVFLLLRSTARDGDLLLAVKGAVEVGADSLKLG